jgi:ribonuclease HI
MSRGERRRDGFTFGGAAALLYICYPVFEPWTFTCCYGVQSGCGPSAPRAVLTISGGNVGDVLQGNCITAVKVWFDGASRNNGSADAATEAGFGVFAVDPLGRVVFEGRGYLGSVSNNVAEFTAFAAACQWVAESNLPSATILGDSELVTDAFHGRKTLRLPALLRHLMVVAKAWLAQAGAVCVEHVPRHGNERADALANAAVDHQSSSMLLRDPLDWVRGPPQLSPRLGLFRVR